MEEGPVRLLDFVKGVMVVLVNELAMLKLG